MKPLFIIFCVAQESASDMDISCIWSEPEEVWNNNADVDADTEYVSDLRGDSED